MNEKRLFNQGVNNLAEWNKCGINPTVVHTDDVMGPIVELYHGSPKAEDIVAQGFVFGQESQYTPENENGVYLSEAWNYAEQHGSVVTVHIPAGAVELYQENPLDQNDYGYVKGSEFIVEHTRIGIAKIVG